MQFGADDGEQGDATVARFQGSTLPSYLTQEICRPNALAKSTAFRDDPTFIDASGKEVRYTKFNENRYRSFLVECRDYALPWRAIRDDIESSAPIAWQVEHPSAADHWIAGCC